MPRTKKETAKETVKETVKQVADTATANEIETKKTVRATARKTRAKADETKTTAKEEKTAAKTTKKVEKTAKKPTVRRKAAKLNMVFQSTMGGSVTPEQIALKLPKEAVDVYVKIEENKAFWVGKNGETGSVDIW